MLNQFRDRSLSRTYFYQRLSSTCMIQRRNLVSNIASDFGIDKKVLSEIRSHKKTMNNERIRYIDYSLLVNKCKQKNARIFSLAFFLYCTYTPNFYKNIRVLPPLFQRRVGRSKKKLPHLRPVVLRGKLREFLFRVPQRSGMN